MGNQVVRVEAIEEWALGVAQEQREFIVERTDTEFFKSPKPMPSVGFLHRTRNLSSFHNPTR